MTKYKSERLRETILHPRKYCILISMFFHIQRDKKSYSDTCLLIHFLCKTFSKFKIIKVSKVSKKLFSDIFQKMGKKKICHKMYKLHPTKLLSLVFDKVLTSPRGVQRQMSTINQFCEENENKFP